MQSILAQIAPIIEAALFSTGHPVKLETLLSLFPSEDVTKDIVKEALATLAEHYAERGVILKEVASGYRFEVNPTIARSLDPLFEEKPGRYSRALLETLALIAYRQPITRSEIEEIRGVVVSTQIIRTLSDHNWIRIVGYRDVPGKPALYATTKEFLDTLSLKSLSELPPLSEIRPMEALDSLETPLIIADTQAMAMNEEINQNTAAENLEEAIALSAADPTILREEFTEIILMTSSEEEISHNHTKKAVDDV